MRWAMPTLQVKKPSLLITRRDTADNSIADPALELVGGMHRDVLRVDPFGESIADFGERTAGDGGVDGLGSSMGRELK